MPVTPTLPGYAQAIRDRRPTGLFDWRARDAALAARSGQAGTFSRTGTATGTDSQGLTVTYRDHQPAWTVVGGLLALSVGASRGRLSWPLAPQHGDLTLYAQLVDRRSGSSEGYVAHLVWASTAYEVALACTGTQAYRAIVYDGTTTRVSASGTVGGAGTAIELLATITAAGVVQLTTSVNGAAGVTAAASASLTRPTLSTSGTLYTAVAPAGTDGSADLLVLRAEAGLRTLDEMRELG